MLRPYSEASRDRSSTSISSPFSASNTSRAISTQPPGLRHLARTCVLGARRAVDQEDARRPVRVLVPAFGFLNRVARREPVGREIVIRIGEFRPGLSCVRGSCGNGHKRPMPPPLPSRVRLRAAQMPDRRTAARNRRLNSPRRDADSASPSAVPVSTFRKDPQRTSQQQTSARSAGGCTRSIAMACSVGQAGLRPLRWQNSSKRRENPLLPLNPLQLERAELTKLRLGEPVLERI